MDIFKKGVVHGFCGKIELSLIAVFTEIMSEKIVFCYFLQRKQSFLDPKIEVLTRGLKMDIF